MSYFVERKLVIPEFNLVQTMESGQALCFERIPVGENIKYFIISGSHTCYAMGEQRGYNCTLTLEYSGETEELDYWNEFFGIGVRGGMSQMMADTANKMLKDKWPFERDYEDVRGIRLIKEDTWQTVVASYLPDTWSVETRRVNMMKMVTTSMRSSGLSGSPELWHFPSAEELLRIPLCASPMQRVGPRLQRLCKEVIAKDINVYSWTKDSGASHSDAVIGLKFLTGHSFNTVVRTVITGFHYDNLYTEECVNTAWLAQNMDEVREMEKRINDMSPMTDYSCIALLYMRIRSNAHVKRKERERFKLMQQKRAAAASKK